MQAFEIDFACNDGTLLPNKAKFEKRLETFLDELRTVGCTGTNERMNRPESARANLRDAVRNAEKNITCEIDTSRFDYEGPPGPVGPPPRPPPPAYYPPPHAKARRWNRRAPPRFHRRFF